MIHPLAGIGIALALLAAAPAGAAELPEFSRPASASEAVRSDTLPFQLWYDPSKWDVTAQKSGYAMFARIVHKDDGAISGAFTYQDGRVSEADVRTRVRKEVEAIFATHEIQDFEARQVNGQRVLFIRASGTTRGKEDKVVRGYYWVGPEGVADYGVLVDRAAFERYRGDILDMLNGLRISRE